MEMSKAVFADEPMMSTKSTPRWSRRNSKYLFILTGMMGIIVLSLLANCQRYGKRNLQSSFIAHHPASGPNPMYFSGNGSLDSHTISSIQNSSLGFERILVINLPTRADRVDGLRLSASLTGIKFAVVPGVQDKDLVTAALPYVWPTGKEPGRGSWRAHMNALNTIVDEGLSSALILEDDIDWDVNIKSQLSLIAQGTQQLGFDSNRRANKTSKLPLHSPYGDDWDVLWLGHCASELRHPADRFLIANDPTVPPPNHRWDLWQPGFNNVNVTSSTRVVSANNNAVCTLAYAVSYAGAQKILYHMGTKPFEDPFDLGLRTLCDARDKYKNDVRFQCLHVWPSLMNSFRPAGKSNAGDSDNNGKQDEAGKVRGNSYAFNTVKSSRMNLGRLINGEEPLPQWKDVEQWQGVEGFARVETRFQERGWWTGDEREIDLTAHYQKPPQYDALEFD